MENPKLEHALMEAGKRKARRSNIPQHNQDIVNENNLYHGKRERVSEVVFDMRRQWLVGSNSPLAAVAS